MCTYIYIYTYIYMYIYIVHLYLYHFDKLETYMNLAPECFRVQSILISTSLQSRIGHCV